MELIERSMNYCGETTTLYFRELNGGEQLRLSSGFKSTVREGVSEVTVDYFAENERGQRLLQMTLINPETQKPVYATLTKMQEEPSSKLSAMVRIARDAQQEYAKRANEAGEG